MKQSLKSFFNSTNIKRATLIILIFINCFSASSQSSTYDQKFPNETLTIAGKSGGDITKEELLSSSGLKSSDSTHEIRGFTIDLLYPHEDEHQDYELLTMTSATANSGELSKEMKDLLIKAPSGTRIQFMEINCFIKYKGRHFVQSITFTIH